MVRDAALWASGRIGWSSYRSMINVSVGEEGIGLSVMCLFRIGHPPILIPWHAVVRCEAGKSLGVFEYVELEVREHGSRLTFYGEAARLIRAGWEKRYPRSG